VIHDASLDGLKVVVGLSLNTRIDDKGKEYVESDLELAVAHFGQPAVIRGQNMHSFISNMIAVATLPSVLQFLIVFIAHMFAHSFCDQQSSFCLGKAVM